ncbi:MAG: 3'-5' exonuclease domain-containing protein 2, partial [Acidovorax sp.]|nr:3'-5' exonuclease domain-containing protein 2 [Acidovorax sp.]
MARMTASPSFRRQPPATPHPPSARTTLHPTPDKDQIALLEPFERLGLDRIALVSTPAQADQACNALASASAWGFDTESKPTFVRDEQSDGPHIVQLATLERAWV